MDAAKPVLGWKWTVSISGPPYWQSWPNVVHYIVYSFAPTPSPEQHRSFRASAGRLTKHQCCCVAPHIGSQPLELAYGAGTARHRLTTPPKRVIRHVGTRVGHLEAAHMGLGLNPEP